MAAIFQCFVFSAAPGESTTAPNPTTVPAKTSPATTPSHTTTASPQTPGKDTSTTPKKSTEEAPKDEAKSNTEGSTKKPPSEQAPSSSQPPPDGSSSGNQSSDASTSGSRSLELMLPGEFIPMPASKGKYKTHVSEKNHVIRSTAQDFLSYWLLSCDWAALDRDTAHS